MNIIIKKNIDLTPALETYLQKKFTSLEKFVRHSIKRIPRNYVEVERTTNHHRKGDVYRATAKTPPAENNAPRRGEADDIRVAIDAAKDTLREEIEKYKEKYKEKANR